jgi:hypothetical protein
MLLLMVIKMQVTVSIFQSAPQFVLCFLGLGLFFFLFTDMLLDLKSP